MAFGGIDSNQSMINKSIREEQCSLLKGEPRTLNIAICTTQELDDQLYRYGQEEYNEDLLGTAECDRSYIETVIKKFEEDRTGMGQRFTLEYLQGEASYFNRGEPENKIWRTTQKFMKDNKRWYCDHTEKIDDEEIQSAQRVRERSTDSTNDDYQEEYHEYELDTERHDGIKSVVVDGAGMTSTPLKIDSEMFKTMVKNPPPIFARVHQGQLVPPLEVGPNFTDTIGPQLVLLNNKVLELDTEVEKLKVGQSADRERRKRERREENEERIRKAEEDEDKMWAEIEQNIEKKMGKIEKKMDQKMVENRQEIEKSCDSKLEKTKEQIMTLVERKVEIVETKMKKVEQDQARDTKQGGNNMKLMREKLETGAIARKEKSDQRFARIDSDIANRVVCHVKLEKKVNELVTEIRENDGGIQSQEEPRHLRMEIIETTQNALSARLQLLEANKEETHLSFTGLGEGSGLKTGKEDNTTRKTVHFENANIDSTSSHTNVGPGDSRKVDSPYSQGGASNLGEGQKPYWTGVGEPQPNDYRAGWSGYGPYPNFGPGYYPHLPTGYYANNGPGVGYYPPPSVSRYQEQSDRESSSGDRDDRRLRESQSWEGDDHRSRGSSSRERGDRESVWSPPRERNDHGSGHSPSRERDDRRFGEPPPRDRRDRGSRGSQGPPSYNGDDLDQSRDRSPPRERDDGGSGEPPPRDRRDRGSRGSQGPSSYNGDDLDQSRDRSYGGQGGSNHFFKPKFPKFDGKSRWETYKVSFEEIADLHEMSNYQRAKMFGGSLKVDSIAADFYATMDKDRRKDFDLVLEDFDTLFGECDTEENFQVKLSKAMRAKNETVTIFAQRVSRLALGAYPRDLVSRNKTGVEAFLNGCGMPNCAFQVKLNGYNRGGLMIRPTTVIEAARAVRDVSLQGGMIAGNDIKGQELETIENDFKVRGAVTPPQDRGRSEKRNTPSRNSQSPSRNESPSFNESVRGLKEKIEKMKLEMSAKELSNKLLETGAETHRNDAEALARAATNILSGTRQTPTPAIQPKGSPSRACFICQSTEHLRQDCPSYQRSSSPRGCYTCGAMDHQQRSCPRRARSPSPAPRRACVHCKSMDHYDRDCPQGRNRDPSPSRMSCFQCHARDHIARDCPYKRRPRSPSPGTRGCYTCGSFDHVDRDCPMKRRSRSTSPRACYQCQSLDHIDRDCPKNVDPCRTCGSSKHIARRCPQSVCALCGGKGHFKCDCPSAKEVTFDEATKK